MNPFDQFLINPILNILVIILKILQTIGLPQALGFSIILLTTLVRFALWPLMSSQLKSTQKMAALKPHIQRIKDDHGHDKTRHQQELSKLYKEHGVNPLAGCLPLLLQLPVLFALYYIFVRSGLPEIQTDILYSFINAPAAVDMRFLGFVDMAATHNLVLAGLVSVSQFIYSRLSMGKTQNDSPVEASLSKDLARSFDFQARYVMPLIIGAVGYFFPAVFSLYMVTANIFMIGQEFFSGRRF